LQRSIIFGDIHGCYDEWRELLDKLKVSENDKLISVGDIIFKGPYSGKCLELAMQLPNLECVLGNHENYFLTHYKNGSMDISKPYHATILKEFGAKAQIYYDFISNWPLYIADENYLVVHAGIRPNIPLKKQNRNDLLLLRNLDSSDTPWHEAYVDKRLIIYGHWARQGLKIKSNSIGLDTGCVYGNKLSAVILPERKIVSVNAKKRYSPYQE
jgi:serine/threonine protein phosphatase 1